MKIKNQKGAKIRQRKIVLSLFFPWDIFLSFLNYSLQKLRDVEDD